ncbi:hypothetical protein H8784_15670 [Parabacteroides acidifaciens]|jgi:hypothetical protein|uniref:Fibrobacter succinogenes major paralogous domain-containing protein n=1 Tax=Parabacteroides acidifaciens TaxID=2290935 RepID=A0A3D8HB58_9BACT|nr:MULTISPECIES: hypothetical protein [Parabacteroides]MBC8603149.1 hypothetical protein [Parabacteroides acidifaciens]RDU48081.1 hypothetical protein DWU89_16055 [Parabacteroides acidifaciens]RHO63368.1 hypothetical protein DW083_21865 [Parabacteroides sp. AF48-14]
MKRRVLLNNEKHRTDVPYVEIGGVKWATTSLITDIQTGDNYFADLPETFGSMFQWGRRYGAPSSVKTCQTGQMTINQGQDLNNASKLIGNNWSANPGPYQYAWCSETNSDRYPTLWTPDKGPYDPCPDGWRVPTFEELGILYNAKYKVRENLNGVDGWYIGDSREKSMFIPYQPNMSWSVPNLDSTFLALLPCVLDTDRTTLYFAILKSNEFQYQRAFMSSGGVIRAVKI